LTARSQEDGKWPPSPPRKRLDGSHVHRVDVGPLLPIHLYIDEALIHELSRVRIDERLALHDMAPVAGRVSDGKEDWPVRFPGPSARLLSPRVPIYGVFGVLAEIEARLASETIRSTGCARHLALFGLQFCFGEPQELRLSVQLYRVPVSVAPIMLDHRSGASHQRGVEGQPVTPDHDASAFRISLDFHDRGIGLGGRTVGFRCDSGGRRKIGDLHALRDLVEYEFCDLLRRCRAFPRDDSSHTDPTTVQTDQAEERCRKVSLLFRCRQPGSGGRPVVLRELRLVDRDADDRHSYISRKERARDRLHLGFAYRDCREERRDSLHEEPQGKRHGSVRGGVRIGRVSRDRMKDRILPAHESIEFRHGFAAHLLITGVQTLDCQGELTPKGALGPMGRLHLGCSSLCTGRGDWDFIDP